LRAARGPAVAHTGILDDAAPCRTESTESPDPALAARMPPGR